MSDVAKIEFLFAGPDVVFRVLQAIIKEPFGQDLLRVQDANQQEAVPRRLGIFAASTDEEFRRRLFALLGTGCVKTIVLGASKEHLVSPNTDSLTWNALSSVCQFAGISTMALLSFIQSRESLKDEATARAHRERLRYVLEGMDLYSAIRRFSHGGTHDVANQFLAPARMLLADGVARDVVRQWMRDCAAKETWDRFIGMLEERRKDEDSVLGMLGHSLEEHCARLTTFCGNGETACVASEAQVSTEAIMGILTECRRLAGQQPDATDRNPSDAPPPVSSGDRQANNHFRILVIDDHSDTWAEVLARVAKRLATQLAAHIEVQYSSNVETVRTLTTTRDVYESLPEYDLVLLDIYLGSKQNGLTLLEEIRKRCHRLPVLIWTTSTASENPASAAHASGFLFKKHATIGKITDAIASSLSAGRSQRLWSLPNPFFDHVLRDPHLRGTALTITKWSLRYMDCFHATDDFHFRYYNDHGGRHIVGVLNVMEKLLRPFLLDQKYRVLPKDDVTREQELFCLYAAIMCHEFGMFPVLDTDEPCDATPASLKPYIDEMFTTKKGKPVVSSTKTILQLVATANASRKKDYKDIVDARRAIHAVRGMMMLASRAVGGTFVPQLDSYMKNVAGLGTVLEDLRASGDPCCELHVAVLIGYHQRLLLLNKEADQTDNFLQLRLADAKWAITQQKFDKANASLGPSQCDVRGVAAILCEARTKLPVDRQMRLRAQCALVRFADALDVDHTRVPADFLLAERDQRRPMQDMEDCKRLVLMTCDIDMGQVSVGFQAPTFDPNMITAWLELSIASIGPKADRRSLASLLESQRGRFAAAWQVDNQHAPRALVEDKYVKDMKTCLEHAVAGYFVKCGELADPSRVNEADAMTLATRLKGWRPAVAHATALLVLYEILDEYCAIVDARLDHVITLNPGSASRETEPIWSKDHESHPSFLDTALKCAELARKRKVSMS